MTSTSPFSGAATSFTDLATNLDGSKSGVAALSYQGSGNAADTVNGHIEKIAESLSELSEAANTTAEKCETQSTIDSELTKAPTKAQVDELKQTYLDTKKKAGKGEATDEELEAAQKAYQEAKKAREDAVDTHETDTKGNIVGDDITDSDDDGSPNNNGNGTDTGGGSETTSDGSMTDSSPLSDTAGNTELSSDDSTAQQQPQMSSQPQSSGQQQQPQAGGGAQPSSGGPPQSSQPQMNMGNTSPKPSMTPDKKSSKDKDPLAFLKDSKVGTTTSGADTKMDTKGVSLSGVTTKADTSGTNSPSVNATGSQPGSGSGNQNGMMGRGGMGGGMMGGMGGAGAGGGGKKEKPVIYTQDKDLLGKESLDQAVEGGMIGRNTSAPTTSNEQR